MIRELFTCLMIVIASITTPQKKTSLNVYGDFALKAYGDNYILWQNNLRSFIKLPKPYDKKSCWNSLKPIGYSREHKTLWLKFNHKASLQEFNSTLPLAAIACMHLKKNNEWEPYTNSSNPKKLGVIQVPAQHHSHLDSKCRRYAFIAPAPKNSSEHYDTTLFSVIEFDPKQHLIQQTKLIKYDDPYHSVSSISLKDQILVLLSKRYNDKNQYAHLFTCHEDSIQFEASHWLDNYPSREPFVAMATPNLDAKYPRICLYKNEKREDRPTQISLKLDHTSPVIEELPQITKNAKIKTILQNFPHARKRAISNCYAAKLRNLTANTTGNTCDSSHASWLKKNKIINIKKKTFNYLKSPIILKEIVLSATKN
ncbi:hypothetical protein HOL34_02145 [bacterium]|jgi:hypothetical protein|nr:hypothetical protein [bacterium]MBT3903699.1 hypothetical protein [bacterium]MBT4577585.1 hypothetical protein [bacterium]MBT5345745.1 hypothetical protein [bacterium]MBT6130914.1 hypothetical protein [bacterium]